MLIFKKAKQVFNCYQIKHIKKMNKQREEIDIKHFEKKLLSEKNKVEKELATVGRKNPQNREDWEAVQPDLNVPLADRNEVADTLEAYEENKEIVEGLESQLNDINDALEKIKNDTYGICEISGEPIEKERLEANPSARTNIANREHKQF